MKKRWQVVLNFSKLTDTKTIAKARKIVKEMEGNAWFPDPDPSLSDLATQAQTTQDAYIASRDAGKTETDIFHLALDELERMMLKEANYVENVANDNPDDGAEIIHSAAMEFKEAGEINIQDFAVKNSKVKGKVLGRMKAQGVRTVYFWDVRKKGEEAWKRVRSSVQSKYAYTGLESETAYEFRGGYQLIDKDPIFFDPITLTVL